MKKVRRYSLITLGCVLFALGFSLFIEPASLAPGGVSGIVVILSHLINEIDTGLFFLLLNLPILIIGGVVFGIRFFIGTVYATLASGVAMSIFSSLFPSPISHDRFCLSLAGAVLTGVGLGLVFREGATTGGTDIIARLIQKKYPHLRIGYIFIILDSVIVLSSGIVFRDINTIIYSAFAVTVSSLVFNYVLYGGFRAHLLIIVANDVTLLTDKLKEITGGTVIEGSGAYSGTRKFILICAIPKRKYASIASLIKEISPDALIIKAPADGFFHGGSV